MERLGHCQDQTPVDDSTRCRDLLSYLLILGFSDLDVFTIGKSFSFRLVFEGVGRLFRGYRSKCNKSRIGVV